MKILILTILITISNMAISAENLLQLNSHNLTLLALKSSTDQRLDEYALFLLTTENSSQYYKFRKDSKKLKQLIAEQKTKLTRQLNNLANQPKFILEQKVNMTSYIESQGLMNIRNFLNSTIKTVARNRPNDGFPDYFFLLMANLEILNNINVEKSAIDKQLILPKKNKAVYLEAILSLPAFQNNKNFQAVIESVRIYESKNKNKLLAVNIEKRKPQQIIDNWLLTGGVTNKLIGIHSFAFFGYRLQDLMGETSLLNKMCKKTIKLKTHQVIVCNQAITDNSALIITFIGGVIAQLDLIATDTLRLDEKRYLSKQIMMQLNKSKTLFENDNTKWHQYNVDFDFYADAFFNTTSIESQFSFAYNRKKQPTDDTLIINMISQATKQLIQDIQ